MRNNVSLFIGIFMTATFQVDTNNPSEIFQRAFNGIINLNSLSSKLANITHYFCYSYRFATSDYSPQKDFALFVKTNLPNNFYIFLIDAGLILEYIYDKLNVLNANRPNDNYDINSDSNVLHKIHCALSQLPINKIPSSVYETLFAQRLIQFDKSLLSEDERKILKLFIQSKKFGYHDYKNNKHYYDVTTKIVIPYFLKLKNLDINSSQLELDMSCKEDYYLIEKLEEKTNINVEPLNEQHEKNIKKLTYRSELIFSKYLDYPHLEFSDRIKNEFKVVKYRITHKLPFFFAFVDNFGKAIGFDKEQRDYAETDGLSQFLKRHQFTQKDVLPDYLYCGTQKDVRDRIMTYKSFADVLIVHGVKRAIEIKDALNDCAKELFIKESERYSKENAFPTESDFIQDMMQVYQDLKEASQFKSDCRQKVLSEAQLSWDKLNGDDIVVI